MIKTNINHMTPVDEARPVEFVHANAGFVLERTSPNKISLTGTGAAACFTGNGGVADTFFYPGDRQRRSGNA